MSKPDPLAEGQPAPDFTLPDASGDPVTLSALDGTVVLYFYPRDDTPGCTIEAVDFSALGSEFEALGATVLGISKDSIESHAKFTKKRELTVRLLSDTGEVAESYGAYGEKKMYGKTFEGVHRCTFVVRDGQIVKAWPKVSPKGHAQEVLDSLKA